MQIDVVADVKTTVGRTALGRRTQRLYWIDIVDGRVFRTTHDGREIRAWDVPMKIGCMALRRGWTARSSAWSAASTCLT